ncbi:Spc7-domain-containing protein [Myriangium duriaei CBS 260.36]|uniref:Spc7-domain-containing protein n=1 Tax=Myriangium duriaei CBS 260.36 TaxID=1168546 RepID=A0A9P4J382_9PEZI|nr:Spc7-domain-containing protein [Myriangium duriaei CBS 260.36]
MAELLNKENVSPSLHSSSPVKSASTSPTKSSRKGARSKSIGPDGILGSQKTTSPDKDRRKSSFAPPVKSILPSKEDEAKRREARRKSLANRRVSFAPEATLHTWDVIEYMREATTSSTSSGDSRRTSRTSEDGDDESDDESVPATPEDQARAQQKKRRRSSVIPPLNFNDPDDIYSSSPVSGSSPLSGSEEGSDVEESEEEGEDEIVDENTGAMSLVSADNTADITSQSMQSNSASSVASVASDSSALLLASLRQAAQQAGTRGPEYDEFGDGYDELPEWSEEQQQQQQEQRSWTEQQGMLTPMAKNLIAVQDQENVNPFSPAFRAHAGRPSTIAEEEEDEEDMSMDMDMTCAVGGMRGSREAETSAEDMTMDFTQVGGKIYDPSPIKSAAKRRRSTTEAGSPMTFGNKSVNENEDMGRAAKRRRSSGVRSSLGDGTMDFTSAFGAIRPSQQEEVADATMEFTTAIGNIVRSQSPLKVSRRQSVRRRRSSVQSVLSMDQTMDFTTAVGAIRQSQLSPAKSIPEEDSNEELSMELTTALGNIAEEAPLPSRPTTPKHLSSPVQADPPTTPKDQDRFKEANDLSAKKLLTPIFVREAEVSPQAASTQTEQSPIRSAKKAAPPSPVKASISPTRTPLQLPPPKSPGIRTPSASPQRSFYPELPEAKSTLTPTPSPRKTPSASTHTTPRNIPSTPERKSSPVKPLSSPFKASTSPAVKAEPIRSPVRVSPKKVTSHPTPNMLDSIRAMSTPRKETSAPATTPLKRLKEMTPRKTPLRTPLAQKRTPRATATQKVQFSSIPEEPQQDEATQQLHAELAAAATPGPPVTLGSFLDAAGVKFMDITASKRRHTVAPTPGKSTPAADATFADEVAAGCSTLPELDLYAHSCRELKKYMSEGKEFLAQLEEEVAADPPPFMRAYVRGTAGQRALWDVMVSGVKARARATSRELWYGWRTQLLLGLQEGLAGIERGLEGDEKELRRRKEVVDGALPEALNERERLRMELEGLLERARMSEAEDKEALDAAREELVETDAVVVEQREVLRKLREELEEQERVAEMLIDTKAEAVAATEEAIRVREASRGISKEEVAAYQASVTALEKSTKWSVAAATGSSLTMTYRSALQLYFNPSAFLPGTSTTATLSRSPSKQAATNAPISLTYIADNEPLTTEKRFFLQLLRAQLHMIDQSSTSARSLLAFVSGGWDTAEAVAETVRKVQLEHPVDVKILSDENLGVEVSMLLAEVQTKVSLAFEVQACVAEDGPEMKLETCTATSGRVIYGEQYKEGKMGEFLGQRVGKAMEGAETAVRELRTRLEKTGRKS